MHVPPQNCDNSLVKIFNAKVLTPLPLADVRTPIKLSVSGRLRWFSYCAQIAGAGALAALVWQGDFSTQFLVIASVFLVTLVAVDALYTGFFKRYREGDMIAFGIHAAARPDVFDTLDNASDVLAGAPGTVATVAKKEPLEIFVQTRAGQILHGQLTTTLFVAPFFTCVRFRVFTETAKKPWFNPSRQILLLPDNIDAEEFRQCRVLLKWT
jgi:hypothetical protein